MERLLEPELMDSWEQATGYDAMDFTEVNTAFAQEAIALGPQSEALILDAGTGPGRIPILICQMQPKWQVIGIDMAKNMLQLAFQHVVKAQLQHQIRLEYVDAKKLSYPDSHFDMVVSNSLVHHLPNPLSFFQEIKRVLKPNGAILIRDLLRPKNEAAISEILNGIGVEYDEPQKKLYHDSLHAALTLDEVNKLVSQVGLTEVRLHQSSDRHWTLERNYKKIKNKK
jgi:ubiquinone/menaquinone biosynthesis C-methylase UbiE